MGRWTLDLTPAGSHRFDRQVVLVEADPAVDVDVTSEQRDGLDELRIRVRVRVADDHPTRHCCSPSTCAAAPEARGPLAEKRNRTAVIPDVDHELSRAFARALNKANRKAARR